MTPLRLGQSIGQFIGGINSGFRAGSTASWEGAERDRRRRRPETRLVAQDTDLDLGTREELISEARNLCQTYGIARSIKRKYALYTVGSCRIKWATGDDKFNKLYNAGWVNWMKLADVNGKNHFRHMTRIAVACMVGEGDIFGQKTTARGFPQLRMIEADRVTNTLGGMINIDDKNIIGGVGLFPDGSPKFYRVCDRNGYGGFENPRDIPATEMFHMLDEDRVDALRGVTHFRAAINPLRDLKETFQAEALAAKKHSKWNILWKVLGGGYRGADLHGNEDPTQGGEQRVNVQEINDGADAYMYPGESAQVMESARPSDGWMSLMEFAVRHIAAALDLPYGLVWHMAGLPGPGVRFEIGQAKRIFDRIIDGVEMHWTGPVAGWWLANQIANKRLPFHPNWASFVIARPTYITIDLGRDSKAGLEENKLGMYSATRWFEETDEDFETETDRMAFEAAYRRRAIKQYAVDGVTIDDVRMLNPNPQQALVAPNGNAPVEE